MDIRLVIHRGATYLAALLMTVGILTLALFAANILLPDEHDFSLREILLEYLVAFLAYPRRGE